MGVLLYRLGGRIGGNRKAASMAKGDMYINLRVYLENSNSVRITLTFDEIEHIIGAPLSPSASNHPHPW